MQRTLGRDEAPLARPAAREVRANDSRLNANQVSNGPMVFVVDDDRQVRESLRLLMQSIDINVETFASGDDFLANYQPRDRGCLVVDVHMPGISGIELIERLADDNVEIPTIVITGYRDPQVERRARELGVVDFVKKPFDPKVLLAMIQDVLSAVE